LIVDRSAALEPSTGALRLLVYFMFLLFAMTSDAVGSVISEVVGQFQLSLLAAGAFHYVPMIAIAVGGLGLGFLADRLGRKRAIVIGLALYCVSSLLFAFGNGFSFFVVLLAISGVGISVFKVGGLALIGDVAHSESSHTRVMNAAEGFFAIGSIIGPAIVATLVQERLSWKWLYVVAAAMCLLLIVVARRMRFPPSRIQESQALSWQGALDVLRRPYALAFATLIMLYVSVEVAIYVWMPTYVQRYTGAQSWLPIYGLTIFFLLRACGRFLGVWLLQHVHWAAVLALCGLAICGCFTGSLLGGVDLAAWLLPASGLPMSVVYPTLNSKAISYFPKTQHGAAAGVFLFFTAAAAALGPLAMAEVSDALGDIRFGFVLATGFAALLAVGLVLNWLAPFIGLRFAQATRDSS
jgi:fucose permease